MATSSTYHVYPTLPSASLLKFFTSDNAPPLSPPVRERSFAQPFNIPPQIYHNALNLVWPVTIALLYASAVTYVNGVNARRKFKPWAFSNTTAFFLLVVFHNVVLALYSAWTFQGMVTAFQKTWPGLRNEWGAAGIVDSLCKMHGPRGLGSAATYIANSGSWSFSDLSMKLEGGLPDTTDVGRLWNEGLAYYGWIFYLSKFYEVVDTAIILIKGKKSSFLQTYHHTGAMFAMWAGIRYMSPPIWMFTCINSFIHTWMYTYYTLVAFGVRVPAIAKRSLTFAQIFQIVFGASYAFAHLVIAYNIPTYMPYRILDNLSTALPKAFDYASSATSAAIPGGDFGSYLKKAALRAAGQEGLAANVRNFKGDTFGLEAIHAAEAQRARAEVVYRLQTTKVNCLDTSGQVFAILLNIVYLVPLAYLFISFFAKYFEKGTTSTASKSQKFQNTKDSADRAASDVAGEIADALGDRQGGPSPAPPAIKLEFDSVKSKSKDVKDHVQNQAQIISGKVRQDLDGLRAKSQNQTKGDGSQSTGNDNKASHDNNGSSPQRANSNGLSAGKNPKEESTASSEAYEVNPDELLDSAEKKAQDNMEPNGS